jgi:hypothetical protein
MSKRWLAVVALGACSLGCESLFIVPTNEDVATWTVHRTSASDREISYRLPPDPEVLVYPRRVAEIAATSRESQNFVNVHYGYGLKEPRLAELKVEMEVKPIDGGGMEPGWSAEKFARVYWLRMFAGKQVISPHYPKFEDLIRSELPELGEATWYQLTYLDQAHGYKICGDIFLRPISPTHVLAVAGLYYDYQYMSPEAIERRRALMRKIVAEVRVEPPFGPVKARASPPAPP